MTRRRLAALVFAAAVLAAAAACARADANPVRELLAAAYPSVIYANGMLEWRSWSWGLASLNLKDASAPAAGAAASLCMSVQPFGALSLKSSLPFDLSGVLGFYIRGNGNNTAAELGGLELQFESSSPGRYSITRSLTLRDLLAAQAAADGGSAADMLAAIQAGQWMPVKISMQAFAPGPAGQPSSSGRAATAGPTTTPAGAFKADRLTMGSCLQRLEGCSSAATPSLDICLDRLVIVNAS